MGVLIFAYAHVRQQFAFDNDFGVGNGFFINSLTLHHLHRAATQRAGDA